MNNVETVKTKIDAPKVSMILKSLHCDSFVRGESVQITIADHKANIYDVLNQKFLLQVDGAATLFLIAQQIEIVQVT